MLVYRSERRLCIQPPFLFDNDDCKLGSRAVQLDLDIAALGGIRCVSKFGPQFLDLDFEFVSHRLISLSVKDDVTSREGMAGAGIAQATGRAGEWGSRFAQAARGLPE
ncbi:hypothetical protein GB927_022020 [Shinella sp. CPCC 100929]|uniref:Uncharacterized protein n=1 Tax=Shinella lacus TaxID=2654216 RepID=A0ABT1RC47_9HYPH|nr:hypothetical protein [Shinella lacus]MCQ4632735.1 hypothetical protein [Shinella lacus]